MLIVKTSILTAGAVLWLAPSIAASSLKRSRRGDDCYKQTVHLAFEKAEKTCFEEAVTAQSQEPHVNKFSAAEFEERFKDLLDYYNNQKEFHTRGVHAGLKAKFEQCFLREARNGLPMTEDAFKQKYENNVARMLETVNNPHCKAKYAEVNVLKKTFVDQKRAQWQKLGLLRRAINTVKGNFVTFTNPKLKECLKNMDEVTLPQLLCAVDGKEAPIVEKKQCYEELMKTEAATTQKTQSDGRPPKTLIRLGLFSKYVVDKLICANIDKQHNVKQNLKGAAKILATWHIAVIFSVVAIPVAAIVYFLVWCMGGCGEGNWGFACLGGIGAVGGAVLGLCLLLYSVFGIPWKALTRIVSYDENSDKVNIEEEFKGAADWFGEAFGSWFRIGADRKDN